MLHSEKYFTFWKKKFFAYAVDSEGLVAADLPGLPRTPLTGSATANVRFLRRVAGGQSVDSGAPARSLHASFIGLSEAIFQNWLHLQTYWGSYFLCVVPERGAPPRALPALGTQMNLLGRGGALSRPQIYPKSALCLGCDHQAFLVFS